MCFRHKPNALLPYFEKFGLDKNNVPYNVEFALRVCLEKPGLIFLLKLLKMYLLKK